VAEKTRQLAKGQSGYYQIVLQVPEDGSERGFSNHAEAERAMQEAEAAYSRGELNKAYEGYLKALAIDPKLYEAALYCGDVLFKQGKHPESWPWFARAIEMDGRRETAYRYWGDSLLAAGRTDEAREKFIDAVLAEPYKRLSWNGLFNWSRRSGVRLSHPRIESPNRIATEGNKTNLTIDASALDAKDGRSFWMLYEMSRAAWKTEGYFQKHFPEEKEYRHTLREEAGALSSVAQRVAEAREKGEIAAVHPSLEPLLKLHQEGLLEAYVLLARADQGIAQDYASYARRFSHKLRQYLSHYVAPTVARE
jgi:tetratricopeptide (TPR) repeat protein